MIIKGKSRSGPSPLAIHLGNAEANEKITLLETRDTIARDLRGALIEMDAYAAGTQCQKPLYHAAISPEPPHRLTPEQRTEAIDALESKLGFTGRARVVVMHEKHGREHIHIVWSRINLDTNRAVSDSHNYRKHEEVARELERQFRHDRVQGAHAEREGVERPERTPSRSELRQEERTGIRSRKVREHVTAIFNSCDNAEAFKAALENVGYVLAPGDRRDFVIVDGAGGIHSLAKRIAGMRAARLRDFMTSIDREALPSLEEAKEIAKERVHASDEASLAAGYGRSDDYVNTTQTALREHQKNQERLNKQSEEDRRRQDEEARQQSAPEAPAGSTQPPADRELSDEQQARLDRLLDAIWEEDHKSDRIDPNRQQQAPGQGRPRSR